MIHTIVALLALSRAAHSSGVGHHHLAAPAGVAAIRVAHIAPVGIVPGPAVAPAPYVAAHSSQYFERTFNRLVAVPIVPQTVVPVAPVAPPPVFVEPVTRIVPLPVTPTQNVPVQPTQHVPIDPNVAIAIATAHASNPVTTILLPPYPVAPQPNFGFVHPIVVPDVQQNKTTTQTTVVTSTTVREPEPTTPLPAPSNTDNSFAQLPTNQNTNVQQVYGPPELPRPLPSGRPQKFKTSVEVVPVPLAYIAPPQIPHHHHHHHHHHHGFKPVKYVHSFIPAKLTVRPVHVHTVRIPAKLVVHKVPVRYVQRSQQVLRPRIDRARDVEPTTFKPFKPVSKPPRL